MLAHIKSVHMDYLTTSTMPTTTPTSSNSSKCKDCGKDIYISVPANNTLDYEAHRYMCGNDDYIQ